MCITINKSKITQRILDYITGGKESPFNEIWITEGEAEVEIMYRVDWIFSV